MSRQAARRKPDQSEPDGGSGILADTRLVLGALWLVSLALQFYVSPDWLTGTVRVADPPVDCVLAEGAGWSSPLSLLADGVFAEWAFLLFGPVTAAFLATIGLRLASFTTGWLVAVFVVGSSLSVEPQHLPPAVLIFAMVAASRLMLDTKRPEVALRVLTGCCIVAVLVTIEFGFVILVAGCLLPRAVAAASDDGLCWNLVESCWSDCWLWRCAAAGPTSFPRSFDRSAGCGFRLRRSGSPPPRLLFPMTPSRWLAVCSPSFYLPCG